MGKRVEIQICYPFICLAILCSLSSTIATPIKVKPAVATEFIILHNNDMHARFEQTSANSGKCTPELSKANKCYGGFARVAHEVRKYREEAKNGGLPVLYLNAGDTYTGTAWFFLHEDKIASAFLNKLQPDVISLGNHEFDKGVDGLVPFLNDVNFPIVAANLDLTNLPALRHTKSLCNSTVLEVNGVRIGVIGYITPETKDITIAKEVEFTDEVEAINKESAKLKADGINIIIALGHSGYLRDQEIAAKCSDVDLVIGGHTNTFLFNGEKQPDTERIDGPYPTMVNQTSGKRVPVVQAYAYTKYLGRLHVQFDINGNLIEYDGTPIILNADVPRDADVLELLESFRPEVLALETAVVGHTRVNLDGRGDACRKRECNLGNLITDAMVHARVTEGFGGTYWTDAAIAFMQGGGIRNTLDKNIDDTVVAEDIVQILPHHNDLFVTKLKGKTILKALEHAATMHEVDSNGGFLQMSGVRTTYDFNKPEGSRVVSTDVRCAACDIPMYEPLDEAKEYKVIIPKYLKDGDNHTFYEGVYDKEDKDVEVMKFNENTALQLYIESRDMVYPGIENRITIIPKTDRVKSIDHVKNKGYFSKNGSLTVVSSGLLVIAALIVVRIVVQRFK